MADLCQLYGADLQVDATGDLMLADGTQLGQQRVLRRLLTNPADDCWHPAYGAGLPRYVGQPVQPAAIAGVIRTQLAREAAVSAQPAPSVQVTGAANGTATASIAYADFGDGSTQLLSLPLGG